MGFCLDTSILQQVLDGWKQEISLLLEDSTAHGMERIGSGPRKRSIFWILTFFLSMFMVSSQCWTLIGQYLSYGKTVSIALREEKLPQFPYITFCSEFFVPDDVEPSPYFVELTKLAKEHITAQQVDISTETDINKIPEIMEAYNVGNISAEHMVDIWYELKEQMFNITDYMRYPGRYNFSDFLELQEMMSYSGPHKSYAMSKLHPESYFFDCSFRGKPCNFSDFSVQKSDSYGNCFTFQSPEYSDTPQDSPKGLPGLKLKVRLPETSEKARAATKAIRISVHDANQLPSFAEDRGLFTPLGIDALIRFNQKALLRYDNRREHCSDVWPLQSRQLDGLAYSDKVCRKLCIEDSLYDECGCALSVLYKNIYPQRQKCMLAENGSHHLCWQQYSSRKVDHAVPHKCDQRCHLPCRDTQYELALSAAKYPHINSIVPELLSLMRSSNSLVRNDSKTFLSDLAHLFNSSQYPSCEQILNKNPDVNVYSLVSCFIHYNPLKWFDEIKKQDGINDLLDKIRSMYATIHVTEAVNDHEIQTEKPEIQFEKLLAEIGGVLGLWVGISIITLMEFLEIIVFSVYFLRSSWNWLSKIPKNAITTSKNNGSTLNPVTHNFNRASPTKRGVEHRELTTYVNCYVKESPSAKSSQQSGNDLLVPRSNRQIPVFTIEKKAEDETSFD
ncbi:degenerin-like protein unc-105 isoform X2 [Symsagittifera roscoffensis]|uniref:degenerin-like protein unc-105 isoform X2 n=1 Tax=Symsagittifera roscoffensis TaxID=84072 RepID=UPI00307CB5D6